MKPSILLFCSIIALSPVNEVFAIMSAKQPLEYFVKNSPGIFHVKVLKIETPFEKEGVKDIRLAFCKVFSTLQESRDQPIIVSKIDGSFYLIVSLSNIAVFSPVGTGNECILFCNTYGLTPTVIGENRIFQIEDGKIRVWATDFPDPKLTNAQIKVLEKDPEYKYKRRTVSLKIFLERVKELQKPTSK